MRWCTSPARRSPGASPKDTSGPSTSSRIEPTRRLVDAMIKRRVRECCSPLRRSGITVETGATNTSTRELSVAAASSPTWSTRWEAATQRAGDAGLRVVTVRTGVVLSARGGMLQLLRPVFLAGLGGRVGDGRQWLSWIDLDDLIDVYASALVDGNLVGAVNAVAPNPVCNQDFTTALARVLRRPRSVPVPKAALGVLVGADGVREVACASQRVRAGTPRCGRVPLPTTFPGGLSPPPAGPPSTSVVTRTSPADAGRRLPLLRRADERLGTSAPAEPGRRAVITPSRRLTRPVHLRTLRNTVLRPSTRRTTAGSLAQGCPVGCRRAARSSWAGDPSRGRGTWRSCRQ